MRCTIDLYKNLSETIDLEKTLTGKTTVEGITRETVDLLNPEIDIKDIRVNDFNYCYVNELSRYYYIENTQIFPNGVCRLYMKVDVLMSYVDDIKASSGLITRQRNYNPYYGKYEVEARTELKTIPFNDVFNKTGVYVLTALKGV